MDGIKVLAFDTGGTILDWHSGISAALAECGGRRGLARDWHAAGRGDIDIGLGLLPDGTKLAQARRQKPQEQEDYTKFVRPEYELGCDVGEKRSREFWQRRFGVSPD